jgi:hypothetical protein
LISQIQITQPNVDTDEFEPILFGVGPLSRSELCVVGERLGNLVLSLVMVENRWIDGCDPVVYERHLGCKVYPLISADGSSYAPVVAIVTLEHSQSPPPANDVRSSARWAIRWTTDIGKTGFVFPSPRFQKWASEAISATRELHD